MSDTPAPVFPVKTADYLDLPAPDGRRVWVQTLNSLQKDECYRKANRIARLENEELVEGGSLREQIIRQIKALDSEQQATLLAGESYRDGSIQRDVLFKHPIPPEPQRAAQGLETEAAWMKAHKKWQAESDKRDKDARETEERLFEEERKKALAMPVAERVERAAAAQIGREFVETFSRHYTYLLVHHATRDPEEHLLNFFRVVRRNGEETYEAADLPDEIKSAILQKYDEMGVGPEEVPTSPPASSE